MRRMSFLRSLGNYCATCSINITRLWRLGIKEFASSIRPGHRRAQKAPQGPDLFFYALCPAAPCGGSIQILARQVYR